MPTPNLERLAERRLRELLVSGFGELPVGERLDALKIAFQWSKVKRAAAQGAEYGSMFREMDEDADSDP